MRWTIFAVSMFALGCHRIPTPDVTPTSQAEEARQVIDDQPKEVQPEKPKRPEGPAIECNNPYYSYLSNIIRADKAYKGKLVKFHTTVDQCLNVDGKQIILVDGDKYNAFRTMCIMEENDTESYLNIGSGSFIIIEGVCLGHKLDNYFRQDRNGNFHVVINECRIIKIKR